MKKQVLHKKVLFLLALGILGCILMAGSDWLMIYGDTGFEGSLAWLTKGAAEIPPWRNNLAMMLAFPAVAFYCAALLGIRYFINEKSHQRIYCSLTALGMTPWLCLHLFYIMILYLYGWLTENGHTEISHAAGEALFGHLFWIVPVGEVIMLLPFFYLIYLMAAQKTIFPRWMAINNPLVIYILLKIITIFIKDCPFRLAFTNGLMSESMIIWFLVFIFWINGFKTRINK